MTSPCAARSGGGAPSEVNARFTLVGEGQAHLNTCWAETSDVSLTGVLSVQVPDLQLVLGLGTQASRHRAAETRPRRLPRAHRGARRVPAARAVAVCGVCVDGPQHAPAARQDRHFEEQKRRSQSPLNPVM